MKISPDSEYEMLAWGNLGYRKIECGVVVVARKDALALIPVASNSVPKVVPERWD